MHWNESIELAKKGKRPIYIRIKNDRKDQTERFEDLQSFLEHLGNHLEKASNGLVGREVNMSIHRERELTLAEVLPLIASQRAIVTIRKGRQNDTRIDESLGLPFGDSIDSIARSLRVSVIQVTDLLARLIITDIGARVFSLTREEMVRQLYPDSLDVLYACKHKLAEFEGRKLNKEDEESKSTIQREEREIPRLASGERELRIIIPRDVMRALLMSPGRVIE